jgi:membrane protein
MVGAMLWAGGSSLLRFYLLNFGQYNRIYGAIGAVIVLLWWLNWGSMAILIGAQFNVTLARLRP